MYYNKIVFVFLLFTHTLKIIILLNTFLNSVLVFLFYLIQFVLTLLGLLKHFFKFQTILKTKNFSKIMRSTSKRFLFWYNEKYVFTRLIFYCLTDPVMSNWIWILNRSMQMWYLLWCVRVNGKRISKDYRLNSQSNSQLKEK